MKSFFSYFGVGVALIIAGALIIRYDITGYSNLVVLGIAFLISGACFVGIVIDQGNEASLVNAKRHRVFQKVEPRTHALTCDKCGNNNFSCVMSYGMAQLELKCDKCGWQTTFLYPKYVDDYTTIPHKGCSVM